MIIPPGTGTGSRGYIYPLSRKAGALNSTTFLHHNIAEPPVMIHAAMDATVKAPV